MERAVPKVLLSSYLPLVLGKESHSLDALTNKDDKT